MSLKVLVPLEYVAGYLRSGYLEGEAEFETQEKENRFRDLLTRKDSLTEEEKEEFESMFDEIGDDLEIRISDFRIEHVGDILYDEAEIIF